MAEPTSMSILSAPAVLTLSAASAQSAAISPAANTGQPVGVTTCRLVSTIDVWLALGTNPTAIVATAGSMLLPAGIVEYIDVPFGYKIAGIAAGAGSLSITAMGKP
jgi:hypothetical protein